MSALGDNLRVLLGGEALAAAENGAVREISPDIDSKELMVDIKALFAGGGNSTSKARMKEIGFKAAPFTSPRSWRQLAGGPVLRAGQKRLQAAGRVQWDEGGHRRGRRVLAGLRAAGGVLGAGRWQRRRRHPVAPCAPSQRGERKSVHNQSSRQLLVGLWGCFDRLLVVADQCLLARGDGHRHRDEGGADRGQGLHRRHLQGPAHLARRGRHGPGPDHCEADEPRCETRREGPEQVPILTSPSPDPHLILTYPHLIPRTRGMVKNEALFYKLFTGSPDLCGGKYE